MARPRQTDPITLWRAIEQAGGIQAYVDAQLVERGFLVERREADEMSDRELDAYKKSLKAEAEERRELRREAWQAYKADPHRPPRRGRLLERRRTSPTSGTCPTPRSAPPRTSCRRSTRRKQLAEALGLTVAELRWLAYHRDAATTHPLPPLHHPQARRHASGRSGPRCRSSRRPSAGSCATSSRSCSVHGAAHGFLPGRSTLTNAAAHTEPEDRPEDGLKDFFPTVTLPRVKGVFRKAGYREQVATLLALLCTESPREIVEHDGKTYYVALGPRCLPQGAPTSPALTNTLCLRLDRRLSGLATKLGWRYTRYADDLTFSLPADHQGQPRLGTLLGSVRRIVEAEGFAIHPDKTARRPPRRPAAGHRPGGQRRPPAPRPPRAQASPPRGHPQPGPGQAVPGRRVARHADGPRGLRLHDRPRAGREVPGRAGAVDRAGAHPASEWRRGDRLRFAPPLRIGRPAWRTGDGEDEDRVQPGRPTTSPHLYTFHARGDRVRCPDHSGLITSNSVAQAILHECRYEF